MKPILGLSILCSFTLFTPQLAEACRIARSMSAADYAFAGVIFEGEIIDVIPERKYNERLKKERVIDVKYRFDVDNVLRGELADTQVLVGYNGHTFGLTGSLENFVERYGKHVRVGLVTPEQHKRHCREEMVEYTRGSGEKFEKLRLTCDFNYSQLQRASEMPFIQTASCANQFIFDTSKPIVLRHYNSQNHVAELVDIFREYSDWFTPELTEGSSKMDLLYEEGLKLYRIEQRTAGQTDEEREETIEWAKARLLKEFLIFANLSETDPELRERFLRDDLSDTSR